MSEVGSVRENGTSPEARAALPAPVEYNQPEIKKNFSKKGARTVEPPARSEAGRKKAEGEASTLGEKAKKFSLLDRIHPDIKKELEKHKVVIKNADGAESELTIIDIGNKIFGEYKQILATGRISSDISLYIEAADKFIKEQREADSGQEFELKLFAGLGAGSHQGGREIFELMGKMREDFSEEAGRDKAAGEYKEDPEPAPFKVDSPEGEKRVGELSEMTGIEPKDVKAILQAAPLFEGAGADIMNAISMEPTPVADSEIEKSGEGVKGDDQTAEAGRGQVAEGAGVGIPAPMGGGDYAKPDDDDGRGKKPDGDRHKRLKDFLKKHFGKEALLMYVLMLLALYCGAVYYTARALEENAERSRAGKSQL